MLGQHIKPEPWAPENSGHSTTKFPESERNCRNCWLLQGYEAKWCSPRLVQWASACTPLPDRVPWSGTKLNPVPWCLANRAPNSLTTPAPIRPATTHNTDPLISPARYSTCEFTCFDFASLLFSSYCKKGRQFKITVFHNRLTIQKVPER